MLDTGFLKQLKQVNISKDVEKTKARFKEVWKAATPAKKKEAHELAGVAANTIYRVGNTGSISIKLAIALAQVLNVDPLYLTGEANDIGEYSDKSVNKLLRKHGYSDKSEKKPRGRRKAAAAPKGDTPENNNESSSKPLATANQNINDILTKPLLALNQDVVANLSGDTIQNLFETLRIKASAGVPDAQEKMEKILELLFY